MLLYNILHQALAYRCSLSGGSEELGEQKKGLVGTSKSIVGYTVRLESRIASARQLTYVTVGRLLPMLEGGNVWKAYHTWCPTRYEYVKILLAAMFCLSP